MESKGVSVHVVKAYRRSTVVAPFVFRHVYKIARSDHHLPRVALLSMRMEQLASHWMEFNKISYQRNFGKTCRENSTFITATLLEDIFTFMTISRWIHFTVGNVSDKSCRENQNTHFM